MFYDLLVLGVIAYSGYRGARKGLTWQLAVIGTLVMCFLFAGTLSVGLSPHVPLEAPLNRWVAMLGIYAIFAFVCFSIAQNMRKSIEKAQFVEFDRHLGFVFGAIKGTVFCLVATFFLVTLSEPARETILLTRSGYAAAIVMDRLHPVMPSELHALLEPYIHELDDAARPSLVHHDHDHIETPPKSTGGGSISIPTGPSNRTPIPDEQIDDVLQEIPVQFDQRLEELVGIAIENTLPEDRPELVERLKTGVPGLIRLVATEWLRGKPATVERTESERMLREIAAVFSDYPDAQEAVVQEIDSALAKLPPSVRYGVLADWHADLLNQPPDPDPTTNKFSSLDDRIQRQLALAAAQKKSAS